MKRMDVLLLRHGTVLTVTLVNDDDNNYGKY